MIKIKIKKIDEITNSAIDTIYEAMSEIVQDFEKNQKTCPTSIMFIVQENYKVKLVTGI